jgi:hypothetical protein
MVFLPVYGFQTSKLLLYTGTAKEQAALSLFFHSRGHPHPRISAGHEGSQAVNLPVKQRKQKNSESQDPSLDARSRLGRRYDPV